MLIVNSGFETPVQGSGNFTYNPTGGTWTFTGTSGITDENSGWAHWGSYPTPDLAAEGVQYAFIQNSGQIAQTFSVSSAQAGLYTVSFQGTERGNGGSLLNPNTGPNTVTLSIDGVVVGTATVDRSGWTFYDFGPLTLTAGSHTLLLSGAGFGGDSTAFIEDVQFWSRPTQSAYSDLVQLDRPVAYWPLNGPGPEHADLGPSKVWLQPVGTVTPQQYAGPLAGESAVGFDGSPEDSAPYSYAGYLVGNGHPDGSVYTRVSSRHLDSCSIPHVNMHGPLTIEAWLYPLGDSSWSGTEEEQGFFGWGDHDNNGLTVPGSYYSYPSGSGISGMLRFSTSAPSYGFRYQEHQYNGDYGNPDGAYSTKALVATDYRNTWIHVCLVVDMLGRTKIYLNGTVQGLDPSSQLFTLTFPPGDHDAISGRQSCPWISIGNLNLAITSWGATGPSAVPSTGWMRGFRGGVAHVALYTYALSSCQIQSHYTAATTGGCQVLPTPARAPVLVADTPSESPAATQLISSVTARLIYLDGYGGYSLAGPSATLAPSGGAGRITVSVGGTGLIPTSVRRVLLYCDSISTVTTGHVPITTDGPSTFFYPVDVSIPGTLPLIELWAHDATNLGGLLNNGQTAPASNTSSVPRPSGGIPDPGSIPAGSSIGGLSGTWSTYGVRYLGASLHLSYEAPSGLPYAPPGHGLLTQLGPGTRVSSGSLTDTVSIPAMSGHPVDATHLWVWVLHYNDGTNLSGFYGYRIAISGGATSAFTFTTDDAHTSTLPGSFSDFRYPMYYDEAIVNAPCTGTYSPPPSASLSYNDLILCDGPDGFWTLDGASSTPYTDLSPNHNDLVLRQLSTNTPPPPPLTLQSTGPILGQGSVGFNGTTWLENGAVTGLYSNDDTTDLSGYTFVSFTYECWFWVPDPATFGNPRTFYALLTLFPSGSRGTWLTMNLSMLCGDAYSPTSTTPAATIFLSGNEWTGGDVNYNPVGGGGPNINEIPGFFGQWHHWVASYEWGSSFHFMNTYDYGGNPESDSTGTTHYIDGVVIKGDYDSCGRDFAVWEWPGLAYYNDWAPVNVVRVGADTGDGYGGYSWWTPKPLPSGAQLAAVAHYPYALSACQVQAHYDKGITGTYTPCGPTCMSGCPGGRGPHHQIQVIRGSGGGTTTSGGGSTYEVAVLADSPVAYWPLTETVASGVTFADLTGHSHTAHLYSDVAGGSFSGPVAGTTAGPMTGESAVLTTVSGQDADAVWSTAVTGLPSDGQPYTVEGWIKPQLSTGFWMAYMAYGTVHYAGSFIGGDTLQTNSPSAGDGYMETYDPANSLYSAVNPPYFDGSWHYFAMTDDAAGTITFYLDGTQISQRTTSASNGYIPGAGDVISLGDPGSQGGTWPGPAEEQYAGGLAHMAIYNVALTSAQVTAHYAARF